MVSIVSGCRKVKPSLTLRFLLIFFRTLATGNNEKFENLVFGVTEKVGKMLTDKGSEQFDPKNIISLAVYNFIAQMVFGKQ